MTHLAHSEVLLHLSWSSDLRVACPSVSLCLNLASTEKSWHLTNTIVMLMMTIFNIPKFNSLVLPSFEINGLLRGKKNPHKTVVVVNILIKTS